MLGCQVGPVYDKKCIFLFLLYNCTILLYILKLQPCFCLFWCLMPLRIGNHWASYCWISYFPLCLCSSFCVLSWISLFSFLPLFCVSLCNIIVFDSVNAHLLTYNWCFCLQQQLPCFSRHRFRSLSPSPTSVCEWQHMCWGTWEGRCWNSNPLHPTTVRHTPVTDWEELTNASRGIEGGRVRERLQVQKEREQGSEGAGFQGCWA